MRLLFVIYGSLQQISGGYLYDRKVIEYLEGQGVEVDCLQLPACPYLLCPFQSLYPPLRRLFRAHQPGGYDCIVIDELIHPSVFLPVCRRVRPGPPVVVLLHHLKIQERVGPHQNHRPMYGAKTASQLPGSYRKQRHHPANRA